MPANTLSKHIGTINPNEYKHPMFRASWENSGVFGRITETQAIQQIVERTLADKKDRSLNATNKLPNTNEFC